jgi:two-component system sensor histidine kinase DesK
MRLLPRDPHLGWTRVVWLVYLGFLFIHPIVTHAGAWQWALDVAAAAVFLPLYFWGYWLSARRALWVVGALAVLGFALAPINPFSATFLIYAAGFLGRVGPPRFGAACLAGLLAILALGSWLLHLGPDFWIVAGLFSLIIGGVNIHFAEVARVNARLNASREENERLAKVAERERIARDLHDLLGHTLSLITLKAELAGRLVAADPERAAAEIREVERISREALREVRTAVAGYRSEGLSAELGRARLALESAGIRAEYFVMPVELGPAAESALAFALREAVTNVVRHAGARSCSIMLEQHGGATRLEVRDDGRGWPGEAGTGSPEQTAGAAGAPAAAPGGTGLAAMRERIAGLGGEVVRYGWGGGDTALEITLPARAAPRSSGRGDAAGSALGASLRPGEAR